MTQSRRTRRTVLKLSGAGLAGGLCGLGTVSASEEPFDAQVRSATNATAKYRDVAEALDDGYEIMGPYVPDMGFHLVHFGRIEQAARAGINPRQPQGLTYNLAGDLGSVEYIVPLAGDVPDVYNDEGEDVATSETAGWHPHHGAQHVFANGNDIQDDPSSLGVDEQLTNDFWAELSDDNPAFPDEVSGLDAGDELEVNWGHQPGDDPETRIVDFVIEHGDWWTLHAWLHFDNPEGLFAPFNHHPDWDPLPPPPHH